MHQTKSSTNIWNTKFGHELKNQWKAIQRRKHSEGFYTNLKENIWYKIEVLHKT